MIIIEDAYWDAHWDAHLQAIDAIEGIESQRWPVDE